MLSRTELGVVVARNGDYYTILLRAGNSIKVKLKNTPLKRGDKCHVCFNNSSGKVVDVLTYDENSCDISTMEYEDPKEINTKEVIKLLEDVESRSVLGIQENEEWEHEELEFWSSECSRSTEE